MKTLSLMIFLLIACVAPLNTIEEPTLDKEFSIKINSHAVIKNEAIKITFNKVLEDSRCPKGARCIDAGSAKISLVLEKNADKKTVELNDFEGGTSVVYQGCEIKFVGLEPYPEVHKPTTGSPIVTLIVSKKK